MTSHIPSSATTTSFPAVADAFSGADVHSLLMQAPALICVLRGPDHVFSLVNSQYQQLIGARDVMGMPLREAMPELEPGYFELLDRVYSTGEPAYGKESPATIDRGEGGEKHGFFNFTYQPLHTQEGNVAGIMVFGFEVTDQVLERERAQTLASDLKKVSDEKDEFLAVVSHELRTPLTAILGWSRMLQLGDLDDATHSSALAAIERSTKAQAQIIEDLLDEARIATGKLRLQMRTLDLQEIIRSAIAVVIHLAEAKGIELIAESAPGLCTVRGDPGRLQQVFANLLTNALKFTPPSGQISIGWRRSDRFVEVSVRDSGEGIDLEFLPSVFDRFRQADTRSGERQGGLGLGLAIVRQLVELHGGSVTAFSAGKGSGATFTVALPLARKEAEAPPFRGRDEHERAIDLPNLQGVKVLVVENEFDTSEMIAAALERCHAMVVCVATAAGGFAETQRWKPDVIVSDIALSGEDGCAFLQRVRGLSPQEGGNIPAIALTVYGRPNERARIRAAGFDIFREKPVEPADLAHEINRLVRRARSSRP